MYDHLQKMILAAGKGKPPSASYITEPEKFELSDEDRAWLAEQTAAPADQPNSLVWQLDIRELFWQVDHAGHHRLIDVHRRLVSSWGAYTMLAMLPHPDDEPKIWAIGTQYNSWLPQECVFVISMPL